VGLLHKRKEKKRGMEGQPMNIGAFKSLSHWHIPCETRGGEENGEDIGRECGRVTVVKLI